MKKNKSKWVDEIMEGMEQANPASNPPDRIFLDTLTARLQSRMRRQSGIVSSRAIVAAAASFALLLAANLFVTLKKQPATHSERVETFMQQEGIYPIIPFESF